MKLIISIFLLSFFSCNHPESSEYDKNIKSVKSELVNISSVENDYFKVIRVIDGDTFYCTDQYNVEYKIRLIGLDTPETRNRGKKKKGYYGEEAKEYLTNLILHKNVKLEFDLDKYDQYNRVLAYVYLPDNNFVNAMLIENGYARIMTIQPNSKYSDLFYKLQQEARDAKKGIWEIEL